MEERKRELNQGGHYHMKGKSVTATVSINTTLYANSRYSDVYSSIKILK